MVGIEHQKRTMNTAPYNQILLRLEGAALLLLALGAYYYGAFSWVLFAVVFLGVDVVLLLYLVSPRAGAQAYALSHNLTSPTIIFFISMVVSWPPGYAIALALAARASTDRLFAVIHTPPLFLSFFSTPKKEAPDVQDPEPEPESPFLALREEEVIAPRPCSVEEYESLRGGQ